MKNKKEISVRIWVSFSILTLLALGVIVKTFMIQFDSSLERSQEDMPSMTAKLKNIEPTRGNILSAEGRLLAASVPRYEIRWDSECFVNSGISPLYLDSMATGMTEIFNEEEGVFKRRFEEALLKKNRYTKLKTKVTFSQLERFKQLPLANKSKYKSGLIIIKQDKREKPFNKLASRTIGEHRDVNPVGIEEAYNEVLAGQEGQQWQQRIAGNVWKPLTDEYVVEPVEGLDVVSTIDVNIQDAATHALEEQMAEHEATWGCMVVMEVESGYVRAVTNLARTEEGTYIEDYNYAIAEQIEPGSTFKLPVMMAALEAGKIAPTDSVETGNGTMEFYGQEIKDSNWKDGGHGTGTAAQMFSWSSNVGMARIVDEGFSSNKQEFLDGLRKLHVHEPLHIALKGETDPIVYDKAGDGAWSGISHIQMAIGYECQQTPLQILSFYNALANDGVYLRPLFAQAFSRNNKVKQTLEPEILDAQLCSEGTLRTARRMMEMVCEEGGTAYRAFKDAPYTVAGKTGTAKIFDYDRRRYFENRYRASFVGYFPAEDPRYAAIVVINDPRSGVYYGSSIAAPVFRKVADRIYTTRMELMSTEERLALADEHKLPVSLDGNRQALEAVYRQLGIPVKVETEEEWVNTATREDHVAVSGRSTPEGRVPNVQGMGLRDALYLLENEGLNVEVRGYGMVRQQSLPPGTVIRARKTITIELG